ncbi:MAG: sodium:proton exchanger [Planctomycetes bacterium]|nr:sodium:proton exchanger [Planctomycetota bacterium]MCP4771363.1 sodium:proton exchanger [Planctomycetota bacterium]MCP4861800.1 sodium:proton exchanger [Planctomycetota bacterium]
MAAMEIWNVLFDILILLFTALVFGVLCERFRQSSILGYLAAGTLLGPNALQVISSAAEVTALADLGVALLLFTIGLEFSWQRVRGLGGSALGGGVAQILVTIGIAAGVALTFAMPWRTSITIGAIVALSSTACVLRLLISRAEIESIHGRHALGVLLMQDIALVPLVLLVTAIGGQGSIGQVGMDIFKTLAWAVALIIVLYVLFSRVMPKVLNNPSMQRNRDLPILLTIVTGLGSAWGAHTLGLSPALGAFVAGMLLAESPFATQIRADIASIRTLLVTLFFSSIGMLGDPVWFVQNLPKVMAVVMAIVVGKAVIVWLVLHRFGLSHTNALATGICLAQVGEFSFVLAEVGRGTLIDESLFALVISVTITTLFLSPYLVALAPTLALASVTSLSKFKILPQPARIGTRPAEPARKHFIIIGFGPAGEAVGQAVERYGKRVTVVDLNPESIARVKQLGFAGHIGDAMNADVLEHVGVASAAAVVVTVPDPASAGTIVELIRSISPEVHIIARVRYHRYLADLTEAGAHEVVDEEQLVGVRLAAQLRRQFNKLA